jgi:fumarate reductase subunit C
MNSHIENWQHYLLWWSFFMFSLIRGLTCMFYCFHYFIIKLFFGINSLIFFKKIGSDNLKFCRDVSKVLLRIVPIKNQTRNIQNNPF